MQINYGRYLVSTLYGGETNAVDLKTYKNCDKLFVYDNC